MEFKAAYIALRYVNYVSSYTESLLNFFYMGFPAVLPKPHTDEADQVRL